MEHLVIYHANCVDGFTAAWVAWLKYGDSAEYIASQYGDEPPDVTDRNVLIVDLSYKRETLLAMNASARSLNLIDHHKTSQADLDGLDFCKFDMGWCGSVLTWKELYPRQSCADRLLPPLICYVNDRDLWKWDLPDSRAVNAYIATIPREFTRWSELDRELASDISVAAGKGCVALRVTEQYVEAQKTRAGIVEIGGYLVPCINTTFAISELVGALAERNLFAAGWFQRDDGRFVYSLRSRDGGVDVAEIARSYGGGGHAKAAGFTVDRLL